MAADGERDEPPGGLSRRAFLRGGAAAGLGATLLRSAPAAVPPPVKTEAGVKLVGPQAVAMSFRVNGKPLTAKLEPRVTLLDALRNQFDLTGAKKVCDRGTCGACTVILDGKSVYACSMLAIEAQAADIRTVEGLGTVEKLHPIQAAFFENDAQQCGFCTPGFVMSAKALLDANPHPSAAELHHALAGNFCRCGTYAGMRKALLGLAAGATAEDEEDADATGEPGDEPEERPRRKGKKNRKHKKRRPPDG